jgi:hypothetical protein
MGFAASEMLNSVLATVASLTATVYAIIIAEKPAMTPLAIRIRSVFIFFKVFYRIETLSEVLFSEECICSVGFKVTKK